MPPRSLELFDLPLLHRYRDEAISLDCLRELTRGNPLRAVNFLAHLDPKQRIYTGVINEGEDPAILGCVIQKEGESFAHLTYLAPANVLNENNAPIPIVEHLAAQAGRWQAHQVLAEIDEESPLFQPLRRSGFAVYGRQRIWDLSEVDSVDNSPRLWRKKKDLDMIPIGSLERQIVPPLLQPIETFTNASSGMICQADELLAYIDVTYGPRGIFLRPLIHPNTEDIREKLLCLLANLSNRRERPVYICVRSYQAWIESILEEIGASVGPRQVVMVKHLVNPLREGKTLPANADKAWANPAAPINGQSAVVEPDK